MKNFHKILKVNVSGKWIELWLDGLPFEKEWRYNEKRQKVITLKTNAYNYSCKTYMIEKLFLKTYKNINDGYRDLQLYGLNILLNYSLCFEDNPHRYPVKLKKY